LGADDLPIFGTEGVEKSEALIDLGAASPALPPQAQIDHEAPIAEIEDFDWVDAEPGPAFPQVGPIAKHVLVPANRCDIGEDRRDVKNRALRVRFLHEVKLAAVPAVEPLLETQPIEDFRRNRLDDASSLPPFTRIELFFERAQVLGATVRVAAVGWCPMATALPRRDTARAMSQENVEIAVSYFEATDLAEAIGALAEDVTLVFHGEARPLSGAGTVSGRKAAVNWLTDWFSRFDPDYRMEVEESRDWGDRVLVVTNHRAKGRASGAPISEQTTQVMTLRDGKIIRQDFFSSLDEALEAAGLRE
jgi:ketosteroid isomerase-like protein